MPMSTKICDCKCVRIWISDMMMYGNKCFASLFSNNRIHKDNYITSGESKCNIVRSSKYKYYLIYHICIICLFVSMIIQTGCDHKDNNKHRSLIVQSAEFVKPLTGMDFTLRALNEIAYMAIHMSGEQLNTWAGTNYIFYNRSVKRTKNTRSNGICKWKLVAAQVEGCDESIELMSDKQIMISEMEQLYYEECLNKHTSEMHDNNSKIILYIEPINDSSEISRSLIIDVSTDEVSEIVIIVIKSIQQITLKQYETINNAK